MERDTSGSRAQALSVSDHKSWVDREGELSVTRQCALLGIACSIVYYQPVLGCGSGQVRVQPSLPLVHEDAERVVGNQPRRPLVALP